MGSKAGHRQQKNAFGNVLVNASSLFALVGAATTLSALPAHAEALQDWGYDTQTQALTLVLPDSVQPTVSIVAPDQLVLELPNTQVGDVMGQTVDDGLVESIVVEQATPETVWMVMEFAEGTVLSTAQNAVPLAETATGDQQWQLRPAFVAASRRAAESTAVAVVPNQLPAVATNGGSADDLRAPVSVAQAPDFSDLPVLEPAVIVDEPVVVPPLRTASPTPVTVPERIAEEPVAVEEVIAADEVAADETADVERDAIAVEVIPAEIPLESPVVSAPASVPGTSVAVPDLPVPTAQDIEETATAVVPEEPPFIGVEEAGVEEAGVEAAGVEEVVVEEGTRLASEPRLTDEQVRAAQFDDEPAVEAVEALEAMPFEQVTPANVSRWPAPIPFGQPLPQ